MSGSIQVVDSFGPLWFQFVGTAPLLIAGLVWLTLGAVLALQGDNMDRPNRVAQLYGYTVCLVSLIVSLIAMSSIIDSAFDRANPLQSEFPFGVTLTSFEGYRSTYQRERGMYDRGGPASPDTASEATLRQRYEASVADRIASTRYRTSKSFVTNGVLLLISLGLFGYHWRWVRRLNDVWPAPA
jgi:hypothetical protein